MDDIFQKSVLQERTFVVAGASSGIGAGFAKYAASLGAKVILIARNQERLTAVCDSLDGEGHVVFCADLSSFDSAHSTFTKIKQDIGKINGVVWASGAELIKPVRSLQAEDLNELAEVSLSGFFGAMKALGSRRIWADDGGSITVLSSVAAHSGTKGMSVYSAVKGASISAVKSLALEFADINVRINSVSMGAVETEMHERVKKSLTQDGQKAYEEKHPLGVGSLSAVLPMLVFLHSNGSKWITGSDIVLDGGYLAG